MKIKLFVPVLLLTAVMLSSCSSTRMTNEWVNPNYENKEIKKIAVVAILKHADTRMEIEKYMAAYLSKNNLKAIAASSLFQDTTAIDKEKMEDVFNSTGIDAVLTLRKIAVDEDASYVPPAVYPYPRVYYNYFYDYYFTAWDAFGSPGYVRINKTFRIENNLYEAKNDKVIWTAVSNTMNPAGKKELAESIAKQIIRRLKKNGMLK